MPKTKTPQHPNSRKAWKRSSLRGRLKLIQKTLVSIRNTLEDEQADSSQANRYKNAIFDDYWQVTFYFDRLRANFEKLFENNPIKTKD